MRVKWLRNRARTRVPLVLYARANCPLCDEMKEQIERARVSRPFDLTQVDIAADPELEARYGLSIPVLAIAGRAAFKGRMTVDDFERKFERRAADLDDPSRAERGAS